MIENVLSSYLNAIGVYPRLTLEEERTLGTRAMAGDTQAQQTMVCANLRLVVVIAKRMVPHQKGIDLLMDAIQEGNTGLMKAVTRFDPSFDVHFSTYGSYWIRQAIFTHLHTNRLIRLPANVSKEIYHLHRLQTTMVDLLGRVPSLEELAAEMKITTQRAHHLLSYLEDTLSLDIDVVHEDGSITSFGDEIEDHERATVMEQAESALQRQHIARAIQRLPSREAEIITLRFGLRDGIERNLQEIGKEYQISRERVRQITIKGLERLQKSAVMLEIVS